MNRTLNYIFAAMFSPFLKRHEALINQAFGDIEQIRVKNECIDREIKKRMKGVS